MFNGSVNTRLLAAFAFALGCGDGVGGIVSEPDCACPAFHACIGGVCETADTLMIRLSEGVGPRWLACPVAKDGRGEIDVAMSGACTVSEVVSEVNTVPFTDVGELLVTGTVIGDLRATQQGAPGGCFESQPAVEPFADLFHFGDALFATATGGATFPPFASEISAPDAIFAITIESEVVAGQDMTIVWTSTGENSEIVVIVDNQDIVIRCIGLEDNGLATIPGELSQYLSPGTPYNVIVSSIARHRFTPRNSRVGIEFQAQSATFARASVRP